MRRRIFFSLIVGFILVFIVGFTSDSVIEECDNTYKDCIKLEKDSTTRKISYIREYLNGNTGPWKRWNKDVTEWIDQFDLFINKNQLLLASYSFISESGDTARYIKYCFRRDGTTALIYNDYRVASGIYYQVITKVYMSHNGEVVRKDKNYFDLKTKKEIDGKGKEENTEPPIYVNVKNFLQEKSFSLK